MPPPSRHLQDESPVSQDELELVADEYRHVHGERRRAQPRGRTRRHLGARLQQLREHFEHLLAAAPLSERDRQTWRSRLRLQPAREARRGDVRPLLFRGRSDLGSELRLTGSPRGTVDALVDGAVVAVLDDVDELAATMPGFVFELDGREFRETFGAGPSALGDLRAALEAGRPPRSEYLRELLEDGLIDRTFGLTPRGRRALALDRSPARHALGEVQPAISVRGHVPHEARARLERALTRLARVSPEPVLRVSGSLIRHEDPANARPVVAKAAIDVNGRTVRAHVAAASAVEAVDLLEARLRRNLRRLAGRDVAGRRNGQAPEPGEWRHGNRPAPRPRHVRRPAERRRLVRRKTYASAAMTPEDAAAEMLLLDHDFHVFVDASSGTDALVYTRPDGVLALRRQNGTGSYVEPFVIDPDPVPTTSAEEAIERLNVGDEPFVFFVDASSRRGAVLYRRYDGNYGLVTAEASP